MIHLLMNMIHMVTVMTVIPAVTVSCLPNGEVSRPPPSGPWVPPPQPGPACKDCPNIIFALTDDQGYNLI